MKRKILSMLLCMAMVFSLISFSQEESFANTDLVRHNSHTITASNVTVNVTSGVAGAGLHTAGQYIAFYLMSEYDYINTVAEDPVAYGLVASDLSGTHPALGCQDPYAYGGLPFANSETKDIIGTIVAGTSGQLWSEMGTKNYKLYVWSESGPEVAKADADVPIMQLINGVEATPLAFGDDTLAGGTVGVSYNEPITAATGGAGGYTYAVTAGTLPDGLAMNPATGNITGTPTAAVVGNTVVTVTVTDVDSATDTADVTIGEIAKGTPVLPTAAGGVKYYTGITLGDIALSGGTPSTGWAWASPTAEVGLTLTSSGEVTLVDTTNYEVPSSNSVAFTLLKGDAAAPTTPVTNAAITHNEISVATVLQHQYGITTSPGVPTWEVPGTGIFSGLDPFTEYYIYSRIGATTLLNPSEPSAALVVKTLKAPGPVAPTESITGTFPVAATSINLAALANGATGLEAAVAIDGSTYAAYAPLTVDGSGNATISGLTGVTTSTKVNIRVAETGTTLAGADKEISVTAAALPAQTGAPAFTAGTPARFGTEITVGSGTLGITSNLTYTWYRSSTAGFGDHVQVGTGTTYTPVQADITKYLVVAATSPEASGNGFVATAAVVAKADGPAAPGGLTGVAETVAGNDGQITGVNDTMEYSTDSNFESPVGTAITGTTVESLNAGTYYVRVKATDTHNAGANAPVTVDAYSASALTGTISLAGTAKYGETLTASVDGGNKSGTLTYTFKNSDDKILQSSTSATYTIETLGGVVAADLIGKTIKVELSTSDQTGTIASTNTAPVVKADGPAAPAASGVGVGPAGNDGQITGVNNTMEYSTDATFTAPVGTPITGTTVESLNAGTYYVRVKATDTHNAGANAPVTVDAYSASALTGTISLAGTAKYGETLTASVDGGNKSGTLTYTFKNSDDKILQSSTSATYTIETLGGVVATDLIGKTIKVELRTNEQSGMIDSIVTAPVEKANAISLPVLGATNVQQDGERGTLTGVNNTMEYSTDAAFTAPIAIIAGPVTGLNAGTYYVRIKETDTSKAGNYFILGVGSAAPNQVTGLTASGDGKLNISWDPAVDNGSAITDYNLFITYSGIITEAGIKVTYTTGTATEIKEIKAVDEAIELSVPGFITIGGIACPVTATSASIISTTGEILHTSGNIGNVTSYELPSATNGTPYHVGIDAINAEGTSVRTSGTFTPAASSSGGSSSGGGGGGAAPVVTPTNVEKTMVGDIVKITANELKTIKNITAKSDKVILNFDEKTVQNLKNKTKSVVEIKVDDVAKQTLTEEARNIIGERPLYNVTVKVDGKEVSTFDGGKIKVNLLYATKAGEDTSKIVAYYVNDKNELELMADSKYSASEKGIVFTTTHFSKYAVGYNKDAITNANFTDVQKGSWYYDNIYYLVNKGIIKGMSDTTFEPENNITRAQFVTILANMSGAKLDASATSTFADVKSNDWYAAAVKWAVEKGIAKGLTDTDFAPNANITREQLSAMLDRYASSVANFKLPKNVAAVTFTDSDAIAEYAKAPVGNMQQAGIINGIRLDDGTYSFEPQSNATRGQAAKMVAEFVKLIEKK